MRISLAYAEDIIGVEGANIEFIRRTSGAILTVQESKGLPEEITVEIKGTSSQVQAAQRLIQTLDIVKNAVALALSPVVRAVDPNRAMRDVRYLDNDHREDQDDTLE